MSVATFRLPNEPDGFSYRAKRWNDLSRRLLDLTVGTAALVVFAPVIGVAAILIKLEDGGPIFFLQPRVGRFGRLFTIYKLRTMKAPACIDAAKPSQANDARITSVGRHLRKLSIDELPQLLNVLRGEMALVGPRPEMPYLVRQYNKPWQQLRHFVTPGITGLWQVTSRADLPLQVPAATAIDVAYIEKASPATDVAILLRTAYSLLSPRGVL